jgi:hypothetical protein
VPVLPSEGSVASARYVPDEDLLFFSDAVYTLPCKTRENRATKKSLRVQAKRLDCLAELIRHEGHHRAEWKQWWPDGYIILLDLDWDTVPGWYEETQPGCSDLKSMSCRDRPTLPGEKVHDIELNAYYVGWSWKLGGADSEDWSCGGKQWRGKGCPK